MSTPGTKPAPRDPTEATEIAQLRSAVERFDGEVARLLRERNQLRQALLDALLVFEVTPATTFRKSYAALIERAERNSP